MIATFYARVSTDSEEQKKSIVSQVDFFKKYIQDNGYEKMADNGVFCKRDGTFENTDGFYVDEGFSGAKSVKYRKAFQQMMKDAKSGKFDIIFTKSISRFGRNVKDLLESIDRLRALNIGVFFEDLKINTLNRSDDFKLMIFAAQAQEESRAKSESVQFGKKEGFKKGIWGGRAPFGYKTIDGRLVVVQEEAKTVVNVFFLYLNESMGVNSIAKLLIKNGVPTKMGGKWSGSMISKMLCNEIYAGTVRLHRTKNIDIHQNLVVNVPHEEQIIYKDENLRIIEDDIFDMCQLEKKKRYEEFGDFKISKIETVDEDGNVVTKVLRTISRGDTRHSSAHLFSNILKCGICGGSLRKKVQKHPYTTYTYWLCRNNDQYGKIGCSTRNLYMEHQLLDLLKKEIKNYQEDEQLHNTNLERYLLVNHSTRGVESKLEKTKSELEELKNEREANFKLYTKNIISEDEYSDRNKKINTSINELQNDISRLTNQESEIEQFKAKYSLFIQTLKSIDIENLKNSSLRKIIDKIVVYPDPRVERFKARVDINPELIKIDWKFVGTKESDLIDEYFEYLSKEQV
ncbi:recombinase family protein [Paenibacillus elgii]|uniref:recombinase family protein n=1 Tax=Paenibacillus elgii TaxID=189691 RepID=UPI002D7A97FB|nr:recombinase family protein [Paenibacillus elgii]